MNQTVVQLKVYAEETKNTRSNLNPLESGVAQTSGLERIELFYDNNAPHANEGESQSVNIANTIIRHSKYDSFHGPTLNSFSTSYF